MTLALHTTLAAKTEIMYTAAHSTRSRQSQWVRRRESGVIIIGHVHNSG